MKMGKPTRKNGGFMKIAKPTKFLRITIFCWRVSQLSNLEIPYLESSIHFSICVRFQNGINRSKALNLGFRTVDSVLKTDTYRKLYGTLKIGYIEV